MEDATTLLTADIDQLSREGYRPAQILHADVVQDR